MLLTLIVNYVDRFKVGTIGYRRNVGKQTSKSSVKPLYGVRTLQRSG